MNMYSASIRGNAAARRASVTTEAMAKKSSNNSKKKGFDNKGGSGKPKSASKPPKKQGGGDRNAAVASSASPPTPFLEIKKADMLSPGEVEKNLEFERRLEELGRQSEAQKSALRAQEAASSDLLQVPNYDNPPPLIQTLSQQKAPTTSAAEEGSFGPSQVVLGALSLALIGVFIVANGGSELGYSAPRTSSTQMLAPEQRNDLMAELERMKTRMEDSPADLEALESAAVLNTQLGDYKKASELLEQLIAAKPADQEALRLLGEVQFQQGDTKRATETFRSAFDASGSKSLEVLTLLTDSYMANGKQKEAVEQVKNLRAEHRTTDGAIGDVELGMLQAKLLAQWRGHSPDAIQLYEELCAQNPDDFRPFLGRGLLLKAEGRMADAQRMFVQARYLAPPSSKATVEALIKGQQQQQQN